MKVKTADLTDAALDWMVGVALGYELNLYGVDPSICARVPGLGVHAPWSPRRYWNQGGPIIDREDISFKVEVEGRVRTVYAEKWPDYSKPCEGRGVGPDHLTAAMRCFVASKLGDEVDVPEELVS